MASQKIPSLTVYGFFITLILAIQIFTQIYQDHVFMCECGFVKFWHGVINSAEDSQHLSDWYTFSHIIHGFLFYWLLKKFTKNRFSIWTYLVLAVALESAWEILENSPIIINRYRETASLMYFGDSIINSLFDVFYMILGFILAWKIPVWFSVALVIFMELFVLYYIRDNLTLNVVMLLYPFEAIRDWQLAA